MHTVHETLKGLELGAVQTARNLAMYPLLAPGEAEPAYLTLDEALAKGYARITEVSEAGTVPELLFVNSGAQPILLLDGEELVGAKQNRTLNLTILVPGRVTLKIPVSCVEAGRWRHVSPEFASGGRVFYAAGRARRAHQVSASMRDTGARVSRQGEVWADISAKAVRLGTASATDAMASMYDQYDKSIDEFQAALHPVTRQIGALFMISGRVVGLELFDAPATLRRTLPKLIASYALDAVDPENGQTRHPAEDPGGLLKLLANSAVREFPAVGLGADLRLDQPGVSGGGLAWDGRLVHLCAFAIERDVETRSGHASTMAPPSRRRRYREGPGRI